MVRSPYQKMISVKQAMPRLGLGLIVCLLISWFTIATPAASPPPHPATEITRLEALLKTAKVSRDRALEARITNDLGIAYKNIGQYDHAIELQKTAGRLFFNLKDRQALGQALINLGNVYAAIGDYEKAQDAYENSLKIANAQHDRQAQAVAWSSLGGIAANYGRDQAAIGYFESALAIHKQLGDREASAYILFNLSGVHHALQQFDRAIHYAKQALTIARALRNAELAATTLTNLALIYDYQKDYPQAIAQHRQAMAIAARVGNPNLMAQVLNNYSYTLLHQGDFAKAETTIRQSIHQSEALRSNSKWDSYKVSLLDTKRFSYQLLQQILIAKKLPEAALEAAEQGRSRAFAELLVQSQKQLQQQSQNQPQNQPQNQLPQSITVNQIQQIAKTQNVTIVEYSLITDRAFRFRGKQQGKAETLMIWVVQPNGKITFRQVDLRSRWTTQGEIRQIVRAARCLQPIPTCPPLDRSTPYRPNPLPSLNYPGLPELHEILIRPIADLLPTVPNDKVVFIPQDVLFLVPFAALPDAAGEYLVQHHTIATAPSIQVLGLTRRLSKTPWSAAQILIAGNPVPMPMNLSPLPHAEMEVMKISQRWQIQPLLGKAVTRSQIISRLPQAKLIHLATHGLLDYGDRDSLDLPGALALAATVEDNGLLTAMEIAQLKLNADLVVLSACDTGRGTISGDGVLGLARSWITAGAANVVVSLWPVRDEATADLMEQFYNALAPGSNYAIALRQAMLTSMKKYPHPDDWAAFSLMGL